MRMFAIVSRSETPAVDASGHPGKSVFEELSGSIPCRIWSKDRRAINNVGRSVVLEDLRGMFPVGADVQEKDRLRILDKQGNVIFPGPIAVESIKPAGGAPGAGPSHLSAMLARHG
jgi:hypothetical protein